MALSLCGRPWCLRQDWRPGLSLRSTIQVTWLWLHSQNRSTQMVENKRPVWPTTFQLLSQPFPLSPPGSVHSLPSSPPLPSMHLCSLPLTKGHAQKAQMLVQYGKLKRSELMSLGLLIRCCHCPPLQMSGK